MSVQSAVDCCCMAHRDILLYLHTCMFFGAMVIIRLGFLSVVCVETLPEYQFKQLVEQRSTSGDVTREDRPPASLDRQQNVIVPCYVIKGGGLTADRYPK